MLTCPFLSDHLALKSQWGKAKSQWGEANSQWGTYNLSTEYNARNLTMFTQSQTLFKL